MAGVLIRWRSKPGGSARWIVVVAALATALPSMSAALDRYEIQVYDAEINEPGQVGLELHLNYTFRGVTNPDYPGQIPPEHVGRITLEPAVGVTGWLEMGAYLQFLVAPGGDARYAGTKLRTKFVLPEPVQQRLGIPVFLALNVELAYVPNEIEAQAWSNEFRPIIGWKSDRWLLALNPILGYALTGPDRFRPDLEPCAKVSFDTRLGFALGVEYYASLGPIGDGFLPVHEQEHLVFGVLDLVEAPRPAAEPGAAPARASSWELNLALGAGLTSATGQHLVAKAIVGRSF